jgi:uncharacterized protein YbjT (DUF2867 family)
MSKNPTRMVKLKLYVSLVLLTFLVIGLAVVGMRTILDPGRLAVFNQSGLAHPAILVWAAYTVVGALLMAPPRTFVIGNVMLLANNVFIIGVYVTIGSLGGAAGEAAAMGFPIFLLWAGHPYTQWKRLRSAPGRLPEGDRGEDVPGREPMKCILLGGSGEVGGAVAKALVESDVCSRLTLLGRRAVDSVQDGPKVEQVVVDTGADDFEEVVKKTAQGHDVAISCLGIGTGTNSMSEEQMMAIEVHLMGKYTQGCKAAGIEIFEFLSAVGVKEKWAKSRIKGLRVGGKKYKTVLETGFEKLAIFKPGMIVGNAHTPRWITVFTGLIPDALGWGNIRQDALAQAFVAHLEKRVATQNDPVVLYGNKEMKRLLAK